MNLKRAARNYRFVGLGNVKLTYYYSRGWIAPLVPIVRLEPIFAPHETPDRSQQDTHIALYAVSDDSVFNEAHRVLSSILDDVPRPKPPAPRVKFIAANKTQDRVNILQLSVDTAFQQPHLYFVYRPNQREGFVISREKERRSLYNTTEVLIELLLMHSPLFGFHGTAVRYGQQGVVFTGRAGAGKTSLMIGLLSRGATFLSDDISIITQYGTIMPLEHKELTIRSSTRTYLQGQGLLNDLPEEQGEAWHPNNEVYRYTSDLFFNKMCHSLTTLTTVFLPRYYAETSTVRITNVSPNDALHTLEASTDLLPWIMQWEKAFGEPSKRATVWKQLQHWLITGRVRVLHIEYGDDLDRAAMCITDYLQS